MLPLGFASGLPLALTAGTLQAWLTVDGVDLQTIGLFSLVGLPYTLKFFWAPVMDRFSLPWLGRRRGWMLAAQLGLLAGILALAMLEPGRIPVAVAAVALMVAFFPPRTTSSMMPIARMCSSRTSAESAPAYR